MTVIERLAEAIRSAGIYNRHDLAAPAAILWTDGDRLWQKAIPQVRAALPELLVLAPQADDEKTGPSTWLRYEQSREKPDDPWVVYLPGVPRSAFRGAAGFPEEARHLFPLQFRGQFWCQSNGRDWTPFAFLSSDDGLGLDVARDDATREALQSQLARVLSTPLSTLSGHRLEASDFHGLAAGDPVRLLLQWMANPKDVEQELGDSGWPSFRAICRERFALDPDTDGVITAAEKVVAGGGAWDVVWQRFCEAPDLYADVRQALDLVKPKDLFGATSPRLPSANRRAEEELRGALSSLGDLHRADALKKLEALVSAHAERANSVWARIGEAPLAKAAKAFGDMVAAIRQGMPGQGWKELAEAYCAGLWMCDAAACQAIGAVREPDDLAAVGLALRSVYRPWLEELASLMGQIAGSYPNPGPESAPTYEPEPGTLLLFVDGLRYDLGVRLRGRLEDLGVEVEQDAVWGALPTVTSTAKPAWQPLARELGGDQISDAFEPEVRATKKALKTPDFRKLLGQVGWPYVPPGETGDPGGCAWAEAGSFDEYGHDQHVKLAWRIDEELGTVSARTRQFLQAGWKRVIIITDHGFLLMPGGLPKVDLPKHLTVSKWGRCALAQPGAQHGYREISWFWGGQHSVVLAPGISAFKASVEYSHGGLTIQEALVPRLTVTTATTDAGREVSVASVKWAGLRLRVQLEGASETLRVDLRTKPADPTSSVLSADQREKPVDADGQVSLRVDQDDLIGTAAILVVLLDGQVICKQAVTIGED